MLKVNQIYNGDCFELLKDIDDDTIDLIVTDPPYDIDITGGGGTINTKKKLSKSLKDLKDTNDITQSYDIEKLAEEINRVQGGNINVYFWCNKKQIYEYMSVYVGKYDCKYEIISWHKKNALPTYYGKYLSDTEYCLFFHKGKGHTFPNSYEDAQTWYIEPINLQDKQDWGHPTIKPIDMIRKLIRNSSKEGETVLDMFLGSGTTACAAIMENRQYIGFEICEDYYKIAEERIKFTTIKKLSAIKNALF